MSDAAGNCVVVCSIENIDPMGVHTGDSWTVAPQQTLPDAEYQRLREAAFACARAVGVATGGANVQFAYEPTTRELALIEMNPRVSRSSALASKATGFPIAKLAALLAVGYTLDELPNDITGKTTAAFEPALDYVAVKAPRFDFDKFPAASRELGTEMRSIGEALGLGRTFPEAFLKALEGREDGARAARDSGAHPYFLAELESIREAERAARARPATSPAAKRFGLPDAWIARVLGVDEARGPGATSASRPPRRRLLRGRVRGADAVLLPVLRGLGRSGHVGRQSLGHGPIVILGSGPNRIGQGIEFDYCCVHAAQAFREARVRGGARQLEPGDGLDRLRHVRPALPRAGDARARARRLRARAAARRRRDARRARPRSGSPTVSTAEGVPLLGDPLPAIDAAEDRGRFGEVLGGARPPRAALGRRRDAGGGARGRGGDRLSGARPAALRPRRPAACTSCAGPRSSRSTSRRSSTSSSRARSSSTSTRSATARRPGWRRSSSTSRRPASTPATRRASSPRLLSARRSRPRSPTSPRRSRAVSGCAASSTCSWRCRDGELFVLEANPRASRTVPFVAKATGDRRSSSTRAGSCSGPARPSSSLPERAVPTRAWAKEAMFPSDRFPTAGDRGPEMRSTGEVMAGAATVSAGLRTRPARGRALDARRPGRCAAAVGVRRPNVRPSQASREDRGQKRFSLHAKGISQGQATSPIGGWFPWKRIAL